MIIVNVITGTPMRESSFEAFYIREYRAMVALAAAVTGSHLLAEDVAQDAMTRVYRRWDRVSGYDRPGAYARRVTINLAISRRRRDAVAITGLRRMAPPPTVPPPEEPYEEVWTAVAALPGKQRAAIALHYLEDRPVDEIAAILDCSPATARVHLHRGRRALASTLEGVER